MESDARAGRVWGLCVRLHGPTLVRPRFANRADGPASDARRDHRQGPPRQRRGVPATSSGARLAIALARIAVAATSTALAPACASYAAAADAGHWGSTSGPIRCARLRAFRFCDELTRTASGARNERARGASTRAFFPLRRAALCAGPARPSAICAASDRPGHRRPRPELDSQPLLVATARHPV